MKYAIVKCINGNFSIHAEGFTSLDKADENFSVVEPYREYITHTDSEE